VLGAPSSSRALLLIPGFDNLVAVLNCTSLSAQQMECRRFPREDLQGVRLGERFVAVIGRHSDRGWWTEENVLHYDNFLGKIARWKDFDQEI